MYVDINGNQFRSYEEACEYYGCDTPAQIAAENAYYERLELERSIDDMEARGTVEFYFPVYRTSVYNDDFPF